MTHRKEVRTAIYGWRLRSKRVEHTAKKGGQPFMAGICAANVLTFVSQALPRS